MALPLPLMTGEPDEPALVLLRDTTGTSERHSTSRQAPHYPVPIPRAAPLEIAVTRTLRAQATLYHTWRRRSRRC